MQWKDLERITKENEEEKAVIVYIHHNPEDFPVVKSVSNPTVPKGRVYLGSYSQRAAQYDQSFESQVKRLEKANEKLREELRTYREKIAIFKDLL